MPEQKKIVFDVFNSFGKTIEINEKLMNSVTALSGSGPAFILVMLSLMIDAGKAVGLTKADSEILAKQTLFGTAKLAIDSKLSPDELKFSITSPGGTTIAGLKALEEKIVSALLS